MDIRKESLQKHYEWNGKIEIVTRCPLKDRQDLSLAYTPGVAEPCLEIQKNPDASFSLTRRGNMVAVITDGTAVLGLGDIGPVAGMPVMEGKCALFKSFADVDAFPICINSKDPDEIVHTIELISGSFGGINLEDISAPRCFEIEEKLQKACDIPVFHDDQHGTAIIVAAALINAHRVVKKDLKKSKVVICGAGAAGTAIAKMLLSLGIKNIIAVDKSGIVCRSRNDINAAMTELAALTNPQNISGSLADAVIGADVFVGVSAPGILTEEMVGSMAKDAIVFAMANPTPEIMPELAKKTGARIVGTGRSDFPNQINNVLVFPGMFRGALDCRAKCINNEMKIAAAYAIASMIPAEQLSDENIVPSALDRTVADAVAKAVMKAAKDSGAAQK